MRTAAETVGRIKQILTGSLADAQETRSVAQEFTQLCIGAQKRLDQCVGLLARGLRTEAIYAAEAAPNLIDLIGKLDFPDAVAWREYVARIPLPVPPPFDVNALQTLDAEWGRHADVEPLVARYRTLCVRRAPVADRITVLRQVRSADGGNPNWGKDLAALETVRFKEIRLALRTIPTEEEAAGYLRELTAADLVATPPADLVADARRVNARIRSERFDRAVRQLGRDVDAAYAAMDLPALESQLSAIDGLSREAGLQIPGDVAAALSDTRAWASEQRASLNLRRDFDRDCAALSMLLAGRASACGSRAAPAVAEIERSLADLHASVLEVPDELTRRAMLAVDSLKLRHRSWRRKVGLTGVAAAVVFIACVVVATHYVLNLRDESAIAARVSEEAQRIAEYADQDLSEGRIHLDRARKAWPSRVNDEPLRAAIEKFERAETAEAGRAARLVEILGKMKSLESNDAMLSALAAEADALGRGEENKKAIADARAVVLARAEVRQKEADARAHEILAPLDAIQTAAANAQDPAEIRRLADKSKTIIESVGSVGGCSPALAAEFRVYVGRQEAALARAAKFEVSARLELEKRAHVATELNEARGLLSTSVARYREAMVALHDKYKGDAAIPSPSQWEPLTQSYDAVLRIGVIAAGGTTVADFRDQASDLQPLFAKTPYAAAGWMKARAEFLQAFEEKAATLRKTLNHPLIRAVNEFTARGPGGAAVRYYTAEATDSAPAASLKYFDDQHRLVGVPGGEVVKPPELAPHSVLAREMTRALKAEQDRADWVSNIPGMMLRAATLPDVNPRVRAIVLDQLAGLDADAGNPVQLTPALRRRIAELSPETDRINFLAPGVDPKVAAALAEVARRISELSPDLVAHLKAASVEATAAARADVAAVYRTLVVSAVVELGADGNPVVTRLPAGTPAPGADAQEFWALVIRDGRPEFVIVATAAADRARTVRWVKGISFPAVGQPLLSPKDGRDTLKLMTAAGLTPGAAARHGWPTNLADLAPP